MKYKKDRWFIPNVLKVGVSVELSIFDEFFLCHWWIVWWVKVPGNQHQHTSKVDLRWLSDRIDLWYLGRDIRTVIFTAHDHEFIQTISNRIIELTPSGIIDKQMEFDEYIESEDVQSRLAAMYDEAK